MTSPNTESDWIYEVLNKLADRYILISQNAPLKEIDKTLTKSEARTLILQKLVEAREAGARDYKHVLEMHGKEIADNRLSTLKKELTK